jgi:hypothetical protein
MILLREIQRRAPVREFIPWRHFPIDGESASDEVVDSSYRLTIYANYQLSTINYQLSAIAPLTAILLLIHLRYW